MEEIYESPERGTGDTLHATLNSLKPQVLTALNNRTYISSLHKTLATKAESTTSLKSLYDYHPSTELDSETKETIAITTANWYNECRHIHPCDDLIQVRKDYDYPLAVLLPVVIQLIATEQVGETITIDTNPSPPYHLNRDTQTKYYHLFKLAASNKFDELRDYLAKQLGLQINYDATGLIRSYDFFGSEGTIILLLRSEELCTKTFNTTCMIGTIGSVITNLESSINKLIPTKCKSCGSSEAICERLSGHFQTIPILLIVEIGHILPRNKQVLISDIDKQLPSVIIYRHCNTN